MPVHLRPLLNILYLWVVTDISPILCFLSQSQEIDVLIGKDRETFYTSGLTLGSKKCSVLRDSLHDDGDWTMDIRTKSQGGEPTYNISVGRAGKGNRVVSEQHTRNKRSVFTNITYTYFHCG